MEKKRKYCDHCGDYVSRTTYRRHQEIVKEEDSKHDDDDSEWNPFDSSFGCVTQCDGMNTLVVKDVCCGEDDTDIFFNDSSDSGSNDNTSIDLDCEGDDEDVLFESEGEDDEDNDTQSMLSPQMRSILIFLLLWQFLFNVPDTGLAMLIIFIYNLLKMFHSLSGNNTTAVWIDKFPSSLQIVHKEIIGGDINFKTYVVCCKCHSLYDFEDCVEVSGTTRYSRKCGFIEFPNHSKQSFRQPCNTLLLRAVKKPKSIQFKPYKVYSYQPLKDGITRLLKRKGFVSKCEHWRHRCSNVDILSDVYDGRVWKDFELFLSQQFSWCIALNVDWFQPYTHVADSVGAIYLVILNLPRQERYRPENMLLVGIIPGPHEPSLNINSYLTPFVLELKEFYEGVLLPTISDSGYAYSVCVRLALVGVFCDLPASRKVCGFCSYNAQYGCHKCMKSFPTSTFGESPDFSGYDTSLWPTRDLATHKQKSIDYLNSSTKAQRKLIEKSYGIRYSVLNELPYFDPIRFTVVDPMHNLFLGTAKRCMENWTRNNILTKDDLQLIEKRMSELVAPHSMGRLPLKISSSFAGFSADQWRNWTVCYSPIALRGILPREHLQYWLLFVKACALFCIRSLHKENITTAHQYLVMFCKKYEEVNGSFACTPNMHLHLHLKDCLLDYGPPYAFWCFAFERYNGILGKFPTNMKNIEPQLMKKCLLLQELHSKSFPVEGNCFKDILSTHLPMLSGGVLISMSCDDVVEAMKLSAPYLNESLDFSVSGLEKCLPPIKLIVLDSSKVNYLECSLYPGRVFTSFSRFAKQSSRVSFGSEVFGSKSTSRENSCIISAYWPTSKDKVDIQSRRFQLSIGQIQYFVKHTLTFTDNTSVKIEHIFACVHWYRLHESFDFFGSSAIVCYPQFESDLTYCFLPVQRISSVCVFGNCNVTFSNVSETVFVAIPVHAKHLFF